MPLVAMNQTKRRNLILGLVGSFLLVFGTYGQLQGTTREDISEPGLVEIYNTVLHRIKTEYVDEVSAKKLWFGAIRGLIGALDDAHTRFMTADEYNELQVETRGNFGGIGFEISLRNGVLTVVSPIDGTPAMRAGIKPGDRIVEIDKIPTKDFTLFKAVKMLRGTPGTSINISVARQGESEILRFDIVREIIQIKVVESAIIKPQNLGYIKLKQFSQNSFVKVKNVVQDFKSKRVKGIILDLRWNPGGLLDAAHKIANLFIKDGIIVSTRGRQKHLDREFPAIPKNAIGASMSIVVLANQGSASASEIVTGALKDLKRGTFIGTKTFGKGSVQNVIPLPYGTAIALTIQKYYTPSGISIHKKGIKPDVEVKPMEFSKSDKLSYRQITNKKLLDNFVKDSTKYDIATIQKFNALLRKNNIELSDFATKFILKQKVQSGRKKPIYDLEFDTQLKAAIKKLG